MIANRSIAVPSIRRASLESVASVPSERPTAAFEAVLDALQDGIIECDPRSRRHLYVNTAFCRLSGLDPFDVFEASWPGPWWSADTARRLTTAMDDMTRRGGHESDEFDGVLVSRDGRSIHVTIRMTTTASPCVDSPAAHRLDDHVSTGNVVVGIVSIRDRSDELAQNEAFAAIASRVLVAEERERIARDLHDNAIQRLFATGLHLQSALGRADLEQRITNAIDEIDDIIRDIRSTIFTLHRPRPLLEGAERAFRSSVAEAERLLGHSPELRIIGDLDLVAPHVINEVLTALREVLSNVAKHAQASHSWVTVHVDEHRLTLTVEDDGIGYRAAGVAGGNGVANLLSRARSLHGHATIAPRHPWGTRVEWSVPADGALN